MPTDLQKVIEDFTPEPLRLTYMSRIEEFFKRDYGPHTAKRIQAALGFPPEIIRTSLHAFRRYGVVTLLKSQVGTNLWLYNPRGDKRKIHRLYRVKEQSRNRGGYDIETRELDPA